MKRSILFLSVFFIAFSVTAQTGYNYYKFGVGLGADVSYERAYTNIPLQYNHLAFSVNVTYNYTPYLPIVAEFQMGKLSGGGLASSQDSLGREYVNNYKAFILHADLQLGGFINYRDNWFLNIIKNLYFGTGVGLIVNNSTVQRTSIYDPTYVFPGTDKGIDIMVPFRFGYEFKIFDKYDEPSIAIDMGYTRNIVFGEGIDGYHDSDSKLGGSLDQYCQLVIGFKYYFGKIASYKKLIRNDKH